MNEEHGIFELIELAKHIEKNPSAVHGSRLHNGERHPPDFDWNVFVNRIDTMIKEDKIRDDPFRKVRLALDSLNADLTYDNRSRAKDLLHSALESLSYEERQVIERRKEEESKVDLESLLVSTYLTDEFWQKAAEEGQKCKCTCPTCEKTRMSAKVRTPVLREERDRYNLLRQKLYTNAHSSELSFLSRS